MRRELEKKLPSLRISIPPGVPCEYTDVRDWRVEGSLILLSYCT